MEEQKEKKKVEINYEIKMYQLLVLFVVSIFVALGLGMWMGNSLGYSNGIDAISIDTPDYCYAVNEGREAVTIKCNELMNVTLADLCKTLSTPLEHKVKILITG